MHFQKSFEICWILEFQLQATPLFLHCTTVACPGGIHFDLVKRVLRDLNRSGLQADEIIQQVLIPLSTDNLMVVQVSDTVYPMYKAFIEPDLKTAQLKVYNKFNPFSGFICNPIYILKSKIELSTDQLLTVLDQVSTCDDLVMTSKM